MTHTPPGLRMRYTSANTSSGRWRYCTETQHRTASKDWSAAAKVGFSLRFFTKNRESRRLAPSSSAFMPWPTTSSYSTSGGRWEIQLLHMSKTRPPGGTRSRYSCVSCAKKASSTCVHILGTWYHPRSSAAFSFPRPARSSTSRRIAPPSAVVIVDTERPKAPTRDARTDARSAADDATPGRASVVGRDPIACAIAL